MYVYQNHYTYIFIYTYELKQHFLLETNNSHLPDMFICF